MLLETGNKKKKTYTRTEIITLKLTYICLHNADHSVNTRKRALYNNKSKWSFQNAVFCFQLRFKRIISDEKIFKRFGLRSGRNFTVDHTLPYLP